MHLVLGGDQAERVELRFVFPPLPDREGWLETFVEIFVKGFRGSIRAFVEIHDLVRFRAQLEQLYQTLSGRAELTPREGQIVLTLEGNGHGGINLIGTAYADPCYGNKLDFSLALDQTFLVEPLRILRTIPSYEASGAA